MPSTLTDVEALKVSEARITELARMVEAQEARVKELEAELNSWRLLAVDGEAALVTRIKGLEIQLQQALIGRGRDLAGEEGNGGRTMPPEEIIEIDEDGVVHASKETLAALAGKTCATD